LAAGSEDLEQSAAEAWVPCGLAREDYTLVDRFRVLTHVLRHESAFSLGTAARKLRAAVDALHRWDSRHQAGAVSPERTRLLRNAASALSAVVIQREALGLRDHALLTNEYGIMPEIWRSMGITDEHSVPSVEGAEAR
jgi:hypothetical protein